jgi:hypothetical protein
MPRARQRSDADDADPNLVLFESVTMRTRSRDAAEG